MEGGGLQRSSLRSLWLEARPATPPRKAPVLTSLSYKLVNRPPRGPRSALTTAATTPAVTIEMPETGIAFSTSAPALFLAQGPPGGSPGWGGGLVGRTPLCWSMVAMGSDIRLRRSCGSFLSGGGGLGGGRKGAQQSGGLKASVEHRVAAQSLVREEMTLHCLPAEPFEKLAPTLCHVPGLHAVVPSLCQRYRGPGSPPLYATG